MVRILLSNATFLLHNYNEVQLFNPYYAWRKSTKLILRRKTTSPATSSTKKNNHILFLSPTLWPEPDASAAGVRTASLLEHFASPNHDLFQVVHYGCGLNEPPPDLFPHVQMHYLPPNRSQKLKQFIQNRIVENDGILKAVVFDRFFAEEAYSFHFCKNDDDGNNRSDDVLRILDMQDMHSLRYYRQNTIQKRDLDLKSCGLDVLQQNNITEDQKERFPTIPIPTRKKSPHGEKNPHEILLRELAAIHRSDLVLVCSQFELDLLRDEYGIKNEKLVLAPFFTKETDRNHQADDNKSLSFKNRKDFISLGGFKHSPNVDQVMMLKKYIWPKIQEQLKGQVPDLKLHIYGSYPPQKVQQLHNKREGFIVHGYINDLSQPLTQGRVLLAPLRYGAGIKGKIIDAWKYGCPVVTTTIGAEGIGDNKSEKRNGWGGFVASDNATFIKEAIRLYTDENLWTRSVSNGMRVLKEQFDEKRNFEVIDDSILDAMKNINNRRRKDYFSAILWHNSFRSTEYFSKWIELKESLHTSNNKEDKY